MRVRSGGDPRSGRARGPRMIAALLLACCAAQVSCPADRGGKGGSSSGTAAPGKRGAEATQDFRGLLAPALRGWMGRMGRNPRAFSRLTGSSEGWNLLWGGEIGRAIEAFEDSLSLAAPDEAIHHRIGLARALIELGEYHHALFDSTVELIEQYIDERNRRRDKIGKITSVERLYQYMTALLGRAARSKAAARASELGALAGHPDARAYASMGRAWQGLALSVAGKDPDAQKAWADAAAAAGHDPNIALLVAYLKARQGLWKGGAALPEGDGSVFGRRLRLAALIRTGQHEQARGELRSMDFRRPDHSLRLGIKGAQKEALPGPVGPAGSEEAAAALREKTSLDFYAPYLLQELARLDFVTAAAVLEGHPGPKGCAAYWRGRALEALGDVEAARSELGKVGASISAGSAAASAAGAASGSAAIVSGKAGATMSPDDPIACLALGSYGSVADLARDARMRIRHTWAHRSRPRRLPRQLGVLFPSCNW